MLEIYINRTNKLEIPFQNIKGITKSITETTGLVPSDFYLEQKGKRLYEQICHGCPIYLRLCTLGGKGGFGSMLRAIGAQIEKTTNREACRDLSGRRLRDINEEKRLKAWLEKQGEREREAEERKKRKIEKLLAVPKHEFKDVDYEEARSKLTEKVCNAVEEGFKKASSSVMSDLKRKQETAQQEVKAKKRKTSLWIDDNLSSDDTDLSEDDDNTDNPRSLSDKREKLSNTSEESNETKTSESDKDSRCGSIPSKNL
ncbi:hypothetical protein DOY81_004386 [Sarcophaga bullata]|nr:hypothetical protein DOY81_004386 [Sarcophaga bullata]